MTKLKKYLTKGLVLGLITGNMPINSFCYYNNISNIKKTNIESREINTWVKKSSSMPIPRENFGSAVVDGKIYIIGGHAGSTYYNYVHMYDPKTDTWERKADLPTARGYFDTAVVDGKIYCMGGRTKTYYKVVEVYDPISNKWSSYPNLPNYPKDGHSMATVNSKIYMIGGNDYGTTVSSLSVYDTKTNTWETKASMPSVRWGFTSEVIDGKIYCIGGLPYMSTSLNAISTLEVYDINTNKWETKANLPYNGTGLRSVIINGEIYCMGGKNNNSTLCTYYDRVQIYNPQTNTWRFKTSMPTPRYAFSSEYIDGKIYCIGGYNVTSGEISTIDMYIVEETLEEQVENAVLKAELLKTISSIEIANNLINQLIDLNLKQEFINRLKIVKKELLLEFVNNAEFTKTPANIEIARDLVNQLSEGDLKSQLQVRLDTIAPNIYLELHNATVNLDLYIKSQNILVMSLDTNSITFEDFSSIQDLEKVNAINVTVNSSLPYQLNAYLPVEIQNADKSNTMDKQILNIKENNELTYKTFTATNEKVVLKDNCTAGNDKKHGIDIKLKGNVAHEKDVYKTTIKFELEQK